MTTTYFRISLLVAIVFSIAALSGCTNYDSEKPLVAATFFPYYDLAKAIAGESAEVYSIVPITTEPHSFEPSPRDIIKLERSALYITTGVELEQFEQTLLQTVRDTAIIVNGSAGISMLAADHHHDENDHHTDETHEHAEHHEEDEHHDEHHEHEKEAHDHDEYHDEHHDEYEHEHHDDEHTDEHHGHHHHHHTGIDPHVWLSPLNAMIIANNIYEGFVELDPANTQYYEQNMQELVHMLEALDAAYRERLASCEKEVILVAHNAYQYLAKEYGFDVISIAGLSHESEPTPRQMTQLIDTAREHGLTVVFFEELVDSRVAEAIAQEVGAETIALSPAEGSPDGKSYIEIMYDNLDKLAYALVCS